MSDYTLRAIPACPACSGPWLNSWRWQHRVTGAKDCPIRRADDATQAADSYRVRLKGQNYSRPATKAERTLWHLVAGKELSANAVTVIYANFVGGVWPRAIGGVASAADITNQAA